MNIYFPDDWTIEQCWEWLEKRSPYCWQFSARLMVRGDGGFYWRHY